MEELVVFGLIRRQWGPKAALEMQKTYVYSSSVPVPLSMALHLYGISFTVCQVGIILVILQKCSEVNK